MKEKKKVYGLVAETKSACPDLEDGTRKKGLMARIFPTKYDFHGMLRKQANLTAGAIKSFHGWLEKGGKGPAKEFDVLKKKADDSRLCMEGELIKAFSTPIDRTDIYEISKQMDQIIDYASLTTKEMNLFEIGSDASIKSMGKKLTLATSALAKGIGFLENDPKKSEALVPSMRKANLAVEKAYLEARAQLLVGEVTMEKLKREDIYHNLKVIMKNVGYTINILHRIIVRLI